MAKQYQFDASLSVIQVNTGIVTTYATGGSPLALLFDRTSIWVATGADGNQTKINPANGQTLLTSSLGWGSSCLAFDGTYIWVCGSGHSVVKILPSIGKMISTYTFGIDGFEALAFDGINMWVADVDCNVWKLATDGTVLGTFPVACFPTGMTFDGINLWVANSAHNTAIKMQPSTGAILATYPVGQAPIATTFDGANLWVANDLDGTVTKIPSTK